MTRTELMKIKLEAKRTGSKWITGYCEYYKDNINKYDMITLGTNSGGLGWNWTLYYCKENDTFYVNGYRNY